jgi:hypothetical protein
LIEDSSYLDVIYYLNNAKKFCVLYFYHQKNVSYFYCKKWFFRRNGPFKTIEKVRIFSFKTFGKRIKRYQLLSIVVTNSEAMNIGVFQGYGNGSFIDHEVYFTLVSQGPQPEVVAFDDFNQLDIVVILLQYMKRRKKTNFEKQ